MKLLKILIISLALFFFQNCFEIIHYIKKNSDNSLTMQWVFSIATPLTKGDNKKENFGDKIKTSESDAKSKLSGIVENLKTEAFSNEMETGVKISFHVKDIKKLNKATEAETNEPFPLVPKFIQEKNQMILSFKPENKEKKAAKDNAPKEKNSPAKDESMPQDAPPGDDPMMTQIVGQVMSSASYKLMLQGFEVKSVYVIGKKSTKKINLDKMDLGQTTLIKIPFMTLLTMEPEGYDVVVQY
ncbi:MAG: hypothetical protein SFU98_09785 [Leptospiraceae bacterium]|nr:hypothetical protein [Leptospiraceae bacterium]